LWEGADRHALEQQPGGLDEQLLGGVHDLAQF
jgi:hypothetical protein